MGYFYLLCIALLFSFGGTCVKLISPYFDASYITFFRFAVAVVVLLVLKTVKRQPYKGGFKQVWGWVIFGAAAKWLAYLSENYAIARGMSYGNIVTQPAQTVFLTLASIILFKEKMSVKKLICMLMCVGGVLCISWNGRPLDIFLGENIVLTGLFWISGTLAGCHVLSQKMIGDRMDAIDSNMVTFGIAAMMASTIIMPSVGDVVTSGIQPNVACILAILLFGFITGFSYYLNAKAIPLVPFYMVPIIQSTMAIFAILWGILFFHEEVSVYIIVGTITFVVGLILLQLLNAADKRKETEHV